jgi:hypothetical protein
MVWGNPHCRWSSFLGLGQKHSTSVCGLLSEGSKKELPKLQAGKKAADVHRSEVVA